MTTPPEAISFSERLRAPWTWWLAIGGLCLLAALSVHQGASGARSIVPYAVLGPLAVAVPLWLSRHRVEVRGGALHVPGARAPLTAFGPAEVLQPADVRAWRGVRAQRDAFVSVRPWHRTAVWVPVVDPEDDTPYWLVGTRRPVDLTVALTTVPHQV